MAQYDILLTQNVAPSGIEFTERYVNITKGAILTGGAGGVPTVFPAGENGHMIVYDSSEPTGLKSQAISAGHTQNTDTGTTSQTFQIDSSNTGPKIKNNSLVFEVRNAADNAYADFRAKNATFDKVTVANAPTDGNDLTNKTYVDGILGANDAMVFKGTMANTGVITSKDVNVTGKTLSQLTNYSAGWTIKYSHATKLTINDVGTLESGDLLICIGDYDSAYAAADWKIIQGNIDGAVTSNETSVTDGGLVVFDGASGKVIKVHASGAPGTMAFETATNYVPKSAYNAHTVLFATTNNTPEALTVAASTFVGRKATGNISAMSAAEARAILNVADGANNYAHPNHSGDVTSAGDGATTIAAGAVSLSKMANVATGTIFYRKTASAGAPEVQTLATLKSDLGTMPIAWSSAPTTKTSTGTAGQAAYDTNFLYVCTATNIWKRLAIATNW